MVDDTTLAVPTLGAPVDGLRAVAPMAVWGAIEAAVGRFEATRPR